MSVSLVVFSVIILPLLSVKLFRLIQAAKYRLAVQLSGMSLPLLIAVYWPYSSGIQGLLELQIAMWMLLPVLALISINILRKPSGSLQQK